MPQYIVGPIAFDPGPDRLPLWLDRLPYNGSTIMRARYSGFDWMLMAFRDGRVVLEGGVPVGRLAPVLGVTAAVMQDYTESPDRGHVGVYKN